MSLLLVLGIEAHLGCLAAVASAPADYWCVVPSTKVPPPEQQLRQIVRSLEPRPAELTVELGNVVESRTLDPARYKPFSRLDGEHVLLIDDSWVTGSSAQSAAAALKLAGAGQVSTLIVARILDPAGWPPTRRYLNSTPDAIYDPQVCPWGGR